MTELIEQYLRLGIVHFMAWPETVRDESLLLPTLEKVALDPVFRYVEIRAIENEKLVEPVREMLLSSGLEPALCAQPAILGSRLDPGSPDSAMRGRTLEILTRHVDQALELGASSVALLSGPDPGEPGREEALERTADLLAQLCEYSAARRGPDIVLEVFDREIDKKALVGPAQTAARLCGLMRSRGASNFGVLVDLSHLPLLGESPSRALNPVQEYLLAAHLGNAVLEKGHPLYGDSHPGFGLPEGVNKVDQVRDFINALKNIGFLNRKNPPPVSFEIKPRPGESTDWIIACAKRTLRRAWALA